jgi:hypothetical protein
MPGSAKKMDRAFALHEAHHRDTAYFGGIAINMCI